MVATFLVIRCVRSGIVRISRYPLTEVFTFSIFSFTFIFIRILRGEFGSYDRLLLVATIRSSGVVAS